MPASPIGRGVFRLAAIRFFPSTGGVKRFERLKKRFSLQYLHRIQPARFRQ
jgi:hypothetical protein